MTRIKLSALITRTYHWPFDSSRPSAWRLLQIAVFLAAFLYFYSSPASKGDEQL